jgi:hypothetical protein
LSLGRRCIEGFLGAGEGVGGGRLTFVFRLTSCPGCPEAESEGEKEGCCFHIVESCFRTVDLQAIRRCQFILNRFSQTRKRVTLFRGGPGEVDWGTAALQLWGRRGKGGGLIYSECF